MTTGRMKTLAATALSVVSLLAASGAQATLFTRLNNQAVYDDQANLTWLRDANANGGNGFGGVMKWLDAMDWAAGLIIDGVSGWRLPGGPMASGYNQTASEMGNMFYTVLGGEAGKDIADIHDATNYALFENVQGYGGYWSGVDSTPDFLKWGFAFDDGDQPVYYSGNNSHVWAVRSGDVGGNPVPAPGRVSVARGGVVGLGRC